VQDLCDFKLTHRLRTNSDLDVLYIHRKIIRYSFQCNQYHSKLKLDLSVIVETKLFFNIHRNTIFSFHKISSLAPPYTHKHEIILFHNALMINLSVTHISFPYLCLIPLFLYNLPKSRLCTSHIYFQFGF
jgi:hypothetical protein